MKFFAIPGISKQQLVLLFLLKTIAGAAVWLIYTYYYPSSDFHLYFKDSKIIVDKLFHNGSYVTPSSWNPNFDDTFFNNSRIIISINVLLQFFSFNNLFVHILFFCFFSFIGLTALYKAFLNHFPQKKYALVVGVYLVPSVLFWTAGIYKETIAILCLGLFIYITDFGLKKNYSTKQIALSVSLFIALFFVKVYVAVALFPVLIVNFIISRTTNKRLWLKYSLVFIALLVIVHILSVMGERTNVYKMLADKQSKSISEAQGGVFLVNDQNFIRIDYNNQEALLLQPDSAFRIKPGSSYLSWKLDNMSDTAFVNNSTDSSRFTKLYSVVPVNTVLASRKFEPSLTGVVKSLPSAIINVLIQPALFSVSTFLQLIAAVENLWLLLLIILSVIFFDKTCWRHKKIILFCLFFVLIQFAEIGLATSAVGAMVRYKVTALPFLVTACLLCINFPAIEKLLNRSKSQDSDTK